MSSPSILFVLERLLERDAVRPGDSLGMFAFGAGLTAFGILATNG
jgi:predicted naringenin-chalcone synthase